MNDETKPIVGQVATVVSTRNLVINRGSVHGVKLNMIFGVFDPATQAITDPETGEVLGSLDIPKIKVRVINVNNKMSLASTYEKVSDSKGAYTLSGLSSLFLPYSQAKYQTFEASGNQWEELGENESIVKRGDFVREIINTNHNVSS